MAAHSAAFDARGYPERDDAPPGKLERLLMYLAARGQRLTDFRAIYAYCDSMNDLPLLSQVSNPVAVNADPVLSAHARHRGWPVMQIGPSR